MEGRDIPYKEFHFNTLSDFFNASNEFHLSKSHGGYMYIRARPKEHSKHIVNMVSEQRMKNTKSRKPRPYQITNLAGYQSQKVITRSHSLLFIYWMENTRKINWTENALIYLLTTFSHFYLISLCSNVISNGIPFWKQRSKPLIERIWNVKLVKNEKWMGIKCKQTTAMIQYWPHKAAPITFIFGYTVFSNKFNFYSNKLRQMQFSTMKITWTASRKRWKFVFGKK